MSSVSLLALVRALAALGLATSALLAAEYSTGAGAVCGPGGGCDAVRLSVWATPLGVPLPLIGIGVLYCAAS